MGEQIARKVAFVGSSCIGKTALLDVYRARYSGDSGVAFVDEAARDFFTHNTVDDRFSAETQGKIQMLALKREQEAQTDGIKATLCDRSVIDAVVYTKAHGDPEGAARLLERVRHWLPTYHTLLLLNPRDIEYQVDDIRTESAAKREQFHEAFVQFFEATDIPYELLSGTIDERTMQVDAILRA